MGWKLCCLLWCSEREYLRKRTMSTAFPFPFSSFLSLIIHCLYSINSFALDWQEMEKNTESRFACFLEFKGASLVAQRLKCLPAMWETWVRSLGREDPLEKEMATHSSTLAWRIPWTEEPGGLQSTGSQRVRHIWATSISLSFSLGVQTIICLQCRRPEFNPWAQKIPWRREWQPTPVFLLGEFHGQRILAGFSPWGCKETDVTERLTLWLEFKI